MDYFTLARVIHVLAVIFWIGGVAMVTTVIIPAVKNMHSVEEQYQTFEKIEEKFSLQAKITVLITGLSGFYMLYELDAWEWYLDYRFWWIHAMTIIWILFMVILFVLEPLVLHKLLKKQVQNNPAKTFHVVHILHWILLLLSLLTVAGAVAGSHGWFFIS